MRFRIKCMASFKAIVSARKDIAIALLPILAGVAVFICAWTSKSLDGWPELTVLCAASAFVFDGLLICQGGWKKNHWTLAVTCLVWLLVLVMACLAGRKIGALSAKAVVCSADVICFLAFICSVFVRKASGSSAGTFTLGDLANMFTILGFFVSFLALWPFAYEQYTKAQEATRLYNTSIMIDQQQDDIPTALHYANEALERLPVLNIFFPDVPKSEDIMHQIAYLNGMASVRELANLDRPMTQEERARANRALGDAKMLEQAEKGRPSYYRPCTLMAQIYAVLDQYDEAEHWIGKAKTSGFSYIRSAMIKIGRLRHDYDCNGLKPAPGAKAGIANDLDAAETMLAGKYSHTWNVATNRLENLLKRNGGGTNGVHEFDMNVGNVMEQLKWLYLWRAVMDIVLASGGGYEKALGNLEKACVCDPNFYLAWYNKGLCYVNMHSNTVAVGCFEKAIKSNPGFAQAYFNIGKIYGMEDKYVQAKAFLRRAVELSPDSISFRLYLGMVMHDMGEFREATSHYEHAIKLDPWNAELYARKALSELGGAKEAEKQVDACKAALSADPGNAVVRVWQADKEADVAKMTKQAKHAIDMAEDVFRQKVDPSGADGDDFCSLTNRFAGDAKTVFDRKNKNMYRIILLTHGDVCAACGEFDRAEDCYNAAAAVKSGLADVHMKRARLLAKKKDCDWSAVQKELDKTYGKRTTDSLTMDRAMLWMDLARVAANDCAQAGFWLRRAVDDCAQVEKNGGWLADSARELKKSAEKELAGNKCQ